MRHIDTMNLKNLILLLTVAFGFAACEKDEDKIYLSSLTSGELIATTSSVVLTQATSADIVLSLAWTKDALQISDPSLKATDLIIQTLQSSLTEDFSGTVSTSTESSLSKAYTGSALNTLAKNIGATADVANTVYFRVAAQTGDNMDPVYSNVVSVSITPYTIDMSVGYILNTDKVETGATLYSANSDGEYLGFMGATSWYNYYMKEGDGKVWGNDGVDGTAFLMSSEDTQWNFWFPGQNGCYYVDINTNTKLWSALLIPALTVSGDIAGEMTFDRQNVKWTYVFTAAQTGTATIQIAGTGNQYNYSTGTDDSSAISTSVAFAQSGENLTFGEQAGNITVSIPETGECTLTLDLSNPKQWTAIVTAGAAEEEEEANPYVYLPGIDDGISGSWTFDNYLRLYDEDNLGYAGVANINSLWGYQIAIEVDNWNDYYGLGEGDAYAGTLVFPGTTNLPAPTAGLYLLNVSLTNLTYALTAVTEVYYSGFNDNWALTAMTATETAGVYTAPVEITGETPWGFQIVLDVNWTTKLGGSDGILLYQGNSSVTNIPCDKTVGTYTLTVDLIKGTYTLE
ncbi:MAG: DUF5114 domain-containing protein [Bacteroides sp.]|nr:DUF5114 domain-containing protein [Bacteroides sp.]